MWSRQPKQLSYEFIAITCMLATGYCRIRHLKAKLCCDKLILLAEPIWAEIQRVKKYHTILKRGDTIPYKQITDNDLYI
jgi:hypothetical protein